MSTSREVSASLYTVTYTVPTEDGSVDLERQFPTIGEACKFALQQQDLEGYVTLVVSPDDRFVHSDDWRKHTQGAGK